MTKRFKFNGGNNCIEYDDKSILLDSYGEDIEELLNELHEENQSLKFQLDECQNHKLFSRRELEKENEQLKRKIQRERTSSTKQHLKWSKEAEQQIQTLQEENEQLRKEVEDLKQALIRCAFDR